MIVDDNCKKIKDNTIVINYCEKPTIDYNGINSLFSETL